MYIMQVGECFLHELHYNAAAAAAGDEAVVVAEAGAYPMTTVCCQRSVHRVLTPTSVCRVSTRPSDCVSAMILTVVTNSSLMTMMMMMTCDVRCCC